MRGFALTQFNADVLGCNVLSGDNTVVAVDTWNPNARANDLDNTQVGWAVRTGSMCPYTATLSFNKIHPMIMLPCF